MKAPRTRDRAGGICFTSSIWPCYLRRTESVEELPPWLYLKGISTIDSGKALAALMGPDAPGLAANTITRLRRWAGTNKTSAPARFIGTAIRQFLSRRSLLPAPPEHDKQCMMVLVGADAKRHQDIDGCSTATARARRAGAKGRRTLRNFGYMAIVMKQKGTFYRNREGIIRQAV